MKSFVPSGSIEALIDDYNQTYYLVQLELKNDSLYNIINNILPEAELFNGPASYHRVMDSNHLSMVSDDISSEYIIILNDGITILIDTFKSILYDVFPNLESIIFSLFELLKDINLFFKDLI